MSVHAPTAPRQRQQTRKPQARSVALLVPPMETGKNAVVRITVGKLAVLYFLDRIPSDWGEAFAFTKTAGGEPPYHANLNADAPSCDCPGHLRWGTECKHLGALRALKALGKLPSLPAVPDLHAGASYKPGHDSDLAF